jgi:hypothetical protein
VKYILHGVRGFGPYLLVELLLPGGSVIALLMWLFRRYSKAHPAEKTKALSAADAGGLCGTC